MPVKATAALPFIVAENGADSCPMLLEERQDTFIEDVDGRDRNHKIVEMPPGVPGITIDNGLEIDQAVIFEVLNHEGADRDKLARKVHLEITFPELRIKPFKEVDLLLREFHSGLFLVLFEAEQPLMLRQ